MKDKIFLDTNVLVYAHTDLDLQKQQKSQQLIINNETIISNQVLGELINVLHKKFVKSWGEIRQVIQEEIRNNRIYTLNQNSYILACDISEKFKFSFYDSLIIAASLEMGCSVIYSEDLRDGQKMKMKSYSLLEIINPFKNV